MIVAVAVLVTDEGSNRCGHSDSVSCTERCYKTAWLTQGRLGQEHQSCSPHCELKSGDVLEERRGGEGVWNPKSLCTKKSPNQYIPFVSFSLSHDEMWSGGGTYGCQPF